MSELWCCHVNGPDDLFAAPDKETAQRWADDINAKKTPTSWFSAEVILWPYSAEAHARHLREDEEEFRDPSEQYPSSENVPDVAGEAK